MWRGGASGGCFIGIGCGFFLAVATLLSPALMAADPSYRYVEINGLVGESGGEDSAGLSFEASYDLGDVVYLAAGYQQSDFDTQPKSDGEFYRLGFGVRGAVTPRMDVLLAAHYGRLDVSVPVPGGGTHSVLDETGALVDLGIRGQMGNAVEYSLLSTFVDWADRGWSYRAGGRYHLGRSPYSIGLHYSRFESEWDQLELGVRYQFD